MEMLIEKIVYPGKSMGFAEGKVVFTDEGLPGEAVDIKILRDKKNYIEAKTLSVLKPSPHRIQSRCDHYKICSPYQCIDYPFQIEIKETQIKEMFLKGLGVKLGDKILKPSPVIWGYRNKAHLNIVGENNRPRLAYHKPDSRDEYVKIDECFLFSDRINTALKEGLDILKNRRLYYANEIIARESMHTKEMLLYAVSDSSLLNLSGKDIIQENVGGKIFFMGPGSFFQINIAMLKELIKDIKGCLALTGKETIADLYCGIGTFGILLAPDAKKVLGVETAQDNISFLKKNISANNITNFTYYEGDSEKFLDRILKDVPDVLIVDPPRKGLSRDICRKLAEKLLPLILYISCDPATLTRDLKVLLGAYKLKRLACYDFFPHTPHIETMCVLSAA